MNNVKVGDSISTMCDARAMNGKIYSVNTGTVVRITPTQVIVLNEHGNKQRFSRATGAAIPQIDKLCPEYMMKSEDPVASKTETHPTLSASAAATEAAIGAYARHALIAASFLAEARAALKAARFEYGHPMPVAWIGDMRHQAALAARAARDNARTALSFAYDASLSFDGEDQIAHARRLEKAANELMANG